MFRFEIMKILLQIANLSFITAVEKVLTSYELFEIECTLLIYDYF